MESLRGRVAIVTGAGRGIGAGVARAFARAGASVVIANRTEARGTAVAEAIERDFPGTRALFVATDVSDQDSIRGLVEQTITDLGQIDILCNNATPDGHLLRLESLPNEVMERFFAVNHYGPMWAMQAVFPHMKERGWGRIITMCSLNGVNAHRYTSMYNSSKEAVRALTRTAAVEWAPYGITCNVICPAAVSPPWEAFERFAPEKAAEVVAANPTGRMGDAEADVGPVAVFLASDGARYVNGNTIHVDGGGHINGVPWNFDPLE